MMRCQIHVFNNSEGTLLLPQNVRGIVKYTVYEEMFLKKIVVSLKGKGVLDIEGITQRRFKENYVHIDKIIQEDQSGFTLSVGNYEEEFNFELPSNIPGSIETKKKTPRHKAECKIQYYVCVKFDRGYTKSDKTFKKVINVKPLLEPRLSLVPVTKESFKQINAFIYKGFIQMIATVENCVLYGGETIVLHYQMRNFTNSSLIRIVINLMEVYTFKPNRPFINAKSYSEVENTTYCTEDIALGENRSDTVQIEVPRNISTSIHSTLVRREYFVKVSVQLPYPHSDMIVKIPIEVLSSVEDDISESPDNEIQIEINESLVDISKENRNVTYPFPPPSYWEAMGETSTVPEETEEDAR